MQFKCWPKSNSTVCHLYLVFTFLVIFHAYHISKWSRKMSKSFAFPVIEDWDSTNEDSWTEELWETGFQFTHSFMIYNPRQETLGAASFLLKGTTSDATLNFILEIKNTSSGPKTLNLTHVDNIGNTVITNNLDPTDGKHVAASPPVPRLTRTWSSVVWETE